LRRRTLDFEGFVETLWGRERIRVVRRGTPPQRQPVLESFRLIPGGARPRFLVPDASRRAAWASLHHFNALRPIGVRVARAALATGFRLGLGGLIAPRQLLICAASECEDQRSADALLSARLSEFLERKVVLAAGIPRPAPYRKPVLEILSIEGEVVAFAKVGWNDVTRSQLDTERAALMRLADARLPSVRAPRFIGCIEWRGMPVSLTEPLPERVRRYRPWRKPPIEATREIATLDEVSTLTLGESGYLARLQQSASQIPLDRSSRQAGHIVVASLLEELTARHAEVPLSFGRCHGDWAPWNLSRLGDLIYVLDWEHSRADLPVGLDIVNFVFYSSYEGHGDARRRPWAVVRSSREFLRALGLDRAAAAIVPKLYFLEMYLSHERAVVEGGTPDPALRHTLVSAMRACLGRA
jgi:hypothetical protein